MSGLNHVITLMLALGGLVAAEPADVPVPLSEEDILARFPDDDTAPPNTAAKWDASLFDAKGKLKPANYLRACASLELADLDRRLGPDWAFFHPPTKTDKTTVVTKTKGTNSATVDGFPLDHLRFADGTWWWNKPEKAASKDWTGHGGQVVYLPEKSGATGIDKMQFTWTHHQDHGGAKFYHAYILKPTISSKDGGEWWCGSPDACTRTPGFQATMAKDPVKTAVALARSPCAWNTHALIAFRNGFITDSGTGNSGPEGRVQLQLPPGKVPTAIAITPNNELGFVTVWDVAKLKGQVAVLALGVQGDTGDASHRPWMLPADAWFSRAKLLGFIDLPFATPSGISASLDTVSLGGLPAQKASEWDFSNAAMREDWAKGPQGAQRWITHAYAQAGYVAVISRAENRLAFINIAPLLQYIRSMYFGSEANAAKTKQEGMADTQWPYAFSAMPKSAIPTLGQVVKVMQPVSVIAGYPTGDSSGFGTRCVVSTMDGTIAIFDVGALNSTNAKSATVEAVGVARVGRNPRLSLTYWPRTTVVAACRGDREIAWISIAGSKPTVTTTLRDPRITDPVCAKVSDSRGAKVLSLADFHGRRVMNFLDGPIDSWGEKLFGGLGKNGDAPFEFVGEQRLEGQPFIISGAEVP